MSPAERGIGYCINADCFEWLRGVFLFNSPNDRVFLCPNCDSPGRIKRTVQTPMYAGTYKYRKVTVEYDYRPLTDTFHGAAIVQDDAAPESYGALLVRDPFVRTAKRALDKAETILSNLQISKALRPPRFSQEAATLDLSADRSTFGRQLDDWAQLLMVSDLR